MKNKSVPGYKRVFAWMIAVFAMVIPWISYLRIWKLTDAQADVFENYSGYVFDFFCITGKSCLWLWQSSCWQ
jgi:hypothetical protein